MGGNGVNLFDMISHILCFNETAVGTIFHGIIISNGNGFHSSKTSQFANLCCNEAAFEPQLLAKIYKMLSKPVFLGARLAGLQAGTQERSLSTEDGMDCVLQEFDDGTGELCLGAAVSVLAWLTVFPILRSDPGLDSVAGAAHSHGFKLSTPTSASDAGAPLHCASGGHGGTRSDMRHPVSTLTRAATKKTEKNRTLTPTKRKRKGKRKTVPS